MTQDAKIKNLTAVTWAHAVNSQQKLTDALNSNVDMIEADIVLGRLNNTGIQLPVMAHPPSTSSDISLESFLQQIMIHNEEHASSPKGIKLDFKTIEVFEGSLDILNEMVPVMSFPVWLNADIVSGPGGREKSIPVDPKRFLTGCSRYKKAVLSIGWTTNWGSNYRDDSYAVQHIDDMLQAIKRNHVMTTKHVITFPVRAGILANSGDALEKLMRALSDTNECSLTIWSSNGDYVDIAQLRQVIYKFGLDRVYLDVPEELQRKLTLDQCCSNVSVAPSARLSSLFNFGVISMCLVATSLWLQRSN